MHPGSLSARSLWWALVRLLLLLAPIAVGAEGFRNAAPGAYGLGQSGGRLAFIDDATAALHNPANLPEAAAGGAAFLASPSVVHIESVFELEGGGRAHTEKPFKLLPNVFLAIPTGQDALAFGLAVTVPYGLSTQWETEGAFGPGGALRYLAPYKSEMLTLQFNPTVAYRVNDRLSVAFGLSARYSELRFEQFFPPITVPVPLVFDETVAEAEMDGWGFGANAALSWDLTERDRIALTLRSETTVDHTGDSRIGNLTFSSIARGFTQRGSAETRVTYPWVVGLAYGRDLTEALRMEVQYERVGFSDFEALNIDLANNNALFAGANNTPQDWDDSFTLGVGLRYDHGSGLRSHVSCQYFESPVPDETLSTTIPDADQIALTVGLTRTWDRAHAGVAYSYVDYEAREATIGGVSGKLQTRLHLFALNVGWRF